LSCPHACRSEIQDSRLHFGDVKFPLGAGGIGVVLTTSSTKCSSRRQSTLSTSRPQRLILKVRLRSGSSQRRAALLASWMLNYTNKAICRRPRRSCRYRAGFNFRRISAPNSLNSETQTSNWPRPRISKHCFDGRAGRLDGTTSSADAAYWLPGHNRRRLRPLDVKEKAKIQRALGPREAGRKVPR